MTERPEEDNIEPKVLAESKGAARALGLNQENGETTFDIHTLWNSFGGWIGVVESVLPSMAFVTVFMIWQNALAGFITASALALGFLARQIILGKSLNQSIAGIVGIAVTGYFTLRQGANPEDFFVKNFFTNAAYGAALFLSVVIRFPILGLLVGALKGMGLSWRKDKAQLRRFDAATMIFVFLFAARLAVQLPLYYSHNLLALGVAHAIMSYPLYALCLWMSWLLLRGIILDRR